MPNYSLPQPKTVAPTPFQYTLSAPVSGAPRPTAAPKFAWGAAIPWLAGGLTGLGALMAPNRNESMLQAYNSMPGSRELYRTTKDIYGMSSRGPAANLARRYATQGGNLLQLALARRSGNALGQFGSGIGNMALSAGRSATSMRLAGIESDLWQQAMQQAQQMMLTKLGLSAQMSRDKQFELLGALIGAGGDALSSWLGGRNG